MTTFVHEFDSSFQVYLVIIPYLNIAQVSVDRIIKHKTVERIPNMVMLLMLSKNRRLLMLYPAAYRIIGSPNSKRTCGLKAPIADASY